MYNGESVDQYVSKSKYFSADSVSEMMSELHNIALRSTNPNAGGFSMVVYSILAEDYIYEKMYNLSDKSCEKEYARQNAEDFTLDKVKQELSDRNLTEGVEARIKGLLNLFEEGKVNVADGASYISPYMVKRQL